MKIRQLLHTLDKSTSAEFPNNFDYASLNRQVRAIRDNLERVLGRKLDLEDGSAIQDASFHADLVLESHIESPTIIFRHSLRFSNFGHLVALTSPESVSPGDLELVLRVVATHGFIFLPTDELDRPYDGAAGWSVPTWWIRYFDYL